MISMRKGYLAVAAALAIVMVLLLEIPALADAIWEPYDDFYEEHYQECEIVNESYLVNSREGYVVIYESPKSSEEVAVIKNGKALHIGCTWKDEKGRVWAAANLYGFEPDEEESLADDSSSGWLFMEELYPAKTPVEGGSAVTGHADKERKTAAILVAGVIVITAVLITLIFGKKKGKKK